MTCNFANLRKTVAMVRLTPITRPRNSSVYTGIKSVNHLVLFFSRPPIMRVPLTISTIGMKPVLGSVFQVFLAFLRRIRTCMAKVDEDGSLYDRVVHHIFFSGEMAPRSKVIEKRLAEQLGVSRIPIRETLGKLTGQGLLVGEESGQGVRVRQYTPEEIRQLYELRELLEGGASAAAARAATDLDIRRMQMICEQSELLHPNEQDLKKWGDLDHAFHAALADASHNDRIARLLKLLLTECHYVFYYLPRIQGPKLTIEEEEAHLREVKLDHRTLLDLIQSGKPEEAERRTREDMRKSSKRLTEAMLAMDIRR